MSYWKWFKHLWVCDWSAWQLRKVKISIRQDRRFYKDMQYRTCKVCKYTETRKA